MSLILTVDGTARGFSPNTLNVTETLGQRSTLEAAFHDTAPRILWTVDVLGNALVSATPHGLSVADDIVFNTAGVRPEPIFMGLTYQVKDADTYSIRIEYNGDPVVIVDSGSGQLYTDLSWFPLVGESVSLADGAIVAFSGTISDVRVSKPFNPEPYRRVTISATDWNQVCDRHLASTRSWAGWKANDIARDIVTRMLNFDTEVLDPPGGEQILLTYVPADTGTVIAQFDTNYCTVSEALTTLAKLAGRRWWIDYGKQLRWVDPNAVTPTWTLQDAPSVTNALMGSIGSRVTREQYANRVVVLFGAYLKDGQSETFTAAADQTDFELDYPCASAPSVTVNGVSKTVGISNVDTGKDCYWSNNSTRINFETAPTEGDTIIVAYTGRDQATIVSQNGAAITERADIEPGTGVYSLMAQVDTDFNPVDAQQYADALVAALSALSTVLTWDSLNMACAVGDRVDVAVTGFPAGIYLVRQVRTFDRDGVVARSIEAQNGPILRDVIDGFKGLTGQGGSTANVFGSATSGTSALSVQIQGVLAIGSDLGPRAVVKDAATIRELRADLKTGPTGSALTVDVLSDSTPIATITVPAGQSSATVTNPGQLAAGANMRVDITAVGSTIPGADLTVTAYF